MPTTHPKPASVIVERFVRARRTIIKFTRTRSFEFFDAKFVVEPSIIQFLDRGVAAGTECYQILVVITTVEPLRDDVVLFKRILPLVATDETLFLISHSSTSVNSI